MWKHRYASVVDTFRGFYPPSQLLTTTCARCQLRRTSLLHTAVRASGTGTYSSVTATEARAQTAQPRSRTFATLSRSSASSSSLRAAGILSSNFPTSPTPALTDQSSVNDWKLVINATSKAAMRTIEHLSRDRQNLLNNRSSFRHHKASNLEMGETLDFSPPPSHSDSAPAPSRASQHVLLAASFNSLHADLVDQIRQLRVLWNNIRLVKQRTAGKGEQNEPVDPQTMLDFLNVLRFVSPHGEKALPEGAIGTLPLELLQIARQQFSSEADKLPLSIEPDFTPFFKMHSEFHRKAPFLPAFVKSIREELLDFIPSSVERLRAMKTKADSAPREQQQELMSDWNHYGRLYAKLCHMTISMACNLSDVQLAAVVISAQRSIAEICLHENQLLQDIYARFDEDNKPPPPLRSRFGLVHPLAKSNLSERAFELTSSVVRDAVRSATYHIEMFNSDWKLFMSMLVPSVLHPQLQTLYVSSIARSPLANASLQYCHQTLLQLWGDVQKFNLPVQLESYSIFASTISTLQYELILQDEYQVAVVDGTHGVDVNRMWIRNYKKASADRATPLFHEKRIPIVHGGQYHNHDREQVIALQRFPIPPQGTLRPDDIDIIRNRPYRKMVDELTQVLLEMRDRLTTQLANAQEPDSGASPSSVLSFPKLSAPSAPTISEQIAVLTQPAKTSPMMSFGVEIAPAASKSMHTPAEAKNDELTVFPRSSETIRWFVPDSQRNSIMLLRVLKPLFLASLRSGYTHEVLSTLQLYIQCSFLPSFKFMMAATELLQDEVTRSGLGGCLAVFPPSMPDHQTVHMILKWCVVIQTHWPLHNEALSFLSDTLSTISAWCLKSLANPQSIRKPWTKEEIQIMQRKSFETLMSVIEVAHSSLFYYRSEYYVDPSMRAKPWQLSLVIGEIERRSKKRSPDAKPESMEKFTASFANIRGVGGDAVFDPTTLRTKTVAELREWLRVINSTRGDTNTLFHASGWVLHVSNQLSACIDRVICEMTNGIDILHLIQRSLAMHVPLSHSAYANAIHQLIREEDEREMQMEELELLPHQSIVDTPYTSNAAWLLLTMCELGYSPPMPALEWVTRKLVETPTLAAHFYLHALRHRMAQIHLTPSAALYENWLAMECSKRELREALARRPMSTARPPITFLSWAYSKDNATSTASHLSNETLYAGSDASFNDHHDILNPTSRDSPQGLQAVLNRVSQQWNFALEASGLLNANAVANTATTTAHPSSSLFSGPSVGASSLSPSSSLFGTRSTSDAATPFHSWLHGVLSMNLDNVISLLDDSRSVNLTPSMEIFKLGLEACVQLIEGKTSSIAAAKGGSLLSALTNQLPGNKVNTSMAAKSLHYGELLYSDMQKSGLIPDVEIANYLLLLYLRSGRHLQVQECLSLTNTPLGFTFASGSLRRIEVPTENGESSVVLAAPISLADEIIMLESVLESLQHVAPAFEKGVADSNEEFNDSGMVEDAEVRQLDPQLFPLYIRPNASTLAVLDACVSCMDYPSNVRSFHSLLTKRRNLEKSIRKKEKEWREQLMKQAEERGDVEPVERTWRRQLYSLPNNVEGQIDFNDPEYHPDASSADESSSSSSSYQSRASATATTTNSRGTAASDRTPSSTFL